MKDKKSIEILERVIKRIYNKNSGMQELIDAAVIDIFTKKVVSPEKIFLFLFSLLLPLL